MWHRRVGRIEMKDNGATPKISQLILIFDSNKWLGIRAVFRSPGQVTGEESKIITKVKRSKTEQKVA